MVVLTADQEAVTELATARTRAKPEDIRRAAPYLSSSPLYGLVCDHVSQLCRDSEQLGATSSAGSIGTATAQLVHALFLSVVTGEMSRELTADTTVARAKQNAS
jgi:hypothetical protein